MQALDAYAQTSGVWGLEMPMALLWKACVVDGNVEHLPGWETGRPSEYAFQDMNLHSLLKVIGPTLCGQSPCDLPVISP